MAITAAKRIAARPFYGEHDDLLNDHSKVRKDIRDRAAYVYVTGQFPTHMRKNYMGILRALTASFSSPSAMDGRSGSIKVQGPVVSDLELEGHPMVQAVRAKIDDGFVIQPSRGVNERKPYHAIFMYRPTRNGNQLITIDNHGDEASGWT